MLRYKHRTKPQMQANRKERTQMSADLRRSHFANGGLLHTDRSMPDNRPGVMICVHFVMILYD
jgi:hypothetical protein